ncbi:MAG: hypothetical protein ACUVWN_09670 [bacterium]
MYIKFIIFPFFVFSFVALSVSISASEPTWLFTVPKTESLKSEHYNVGFIYFDFGITNELEIGIHGLKYSTGNFAFGLSLYPLGTPYLVFKSDTSSTDLYLGIKAAPYLFFAGLEAPVTNNVKFIAEVNNGLTAGVRAIPAKNWTLDVFLAFISFEVYKYKYKSIEIEQFRAIPFISFAYSGRF